MDPYDEIHEEQTLKEGKLHENSEEEEENDEVRLLKEKITKFAGLCRPKKNWYPCWVCFFEHADAKVYTSSVLKTHASSHTDHKEVCYICSNRMMEPLEMYFHLKIVHKKTSKYLRKKKKPRK